MAEESRLEFDITVVGIPAALELAESVPARIAAPTIRSSFLKLLEFGKEQMMMAILRSTRTADKTTGRLVKSVEGHLYPTGASPSAEGFEDYEFIIGSALAHAFYAASDIRETPMFRSVKVAPGRWRFIGMRPPIPKHPFLEETALELYNMIPRYLGEDLHHFAGEVQKRVQDLQRSEAGGGIIET